MINRSRIKEYRPLFDRVCRYLESTNLEETLNHCYTDLNTLGLHDAMVHYEYARDHLESKIMQLYEVFYTAQATEKATKTEGE